LWGIVVDKTSKSERVLVGFPQMDALMEVWNGGSV